MSLQVWIMLLSAMSAQKLLLLLLLHRRASDSARPAARVRLLLGTLFAAWSPLSLDL